MLLHHQFTIQQNAEMANDVDRFNDGGSNSQRCTTRCTSRWQALYCCTWA